MQRARTTVYIGGKEAGQTQKALRFRFHLPPLRFPLRASRAVLRVDVTRLHFVSRCSLRQFGDGDGIVAPRLADTIPSLSRRLRSEYRVGVWSSQIIS